MQFLAQYVDWVYLVAAILFILALKGLSSPLGASTVRCSSITVSVAGTVPAGPHCTRVGPEPVVRSLSFRMPSRRATSW